MDDVDAVLFDLDGTLCVHDQDAETLLDRAFDRAGTVPLFEPAHATAVDTSALPTAESPREFHRNLFAAAAERAGERPDDAVLDAVVEGYLDARDPAAVSFRPGAREALAAARERHPVGLVTNGDEATQAAKLDVLGVRDAFDATVFCDPAAGIEPKPDPAPLSMAVDDLGVAPDGAVFVGDSLDADVAGAHNAGLHSAWVAHADDVREPEPEPTYRFDSMSEVAALLEE